jgi:hypothetical protein
MADFELPFPRKGLSDDLPKGKQSPNTSGDLQNVRLIDPTTGRSTGAQRAGLSRYLDSPLVTEDQPVQALAQTMRPVDHIQFTSLASSTPGKATSSAMGSIAFDAVADIDWQGIAPGVDPGDFITLRDGTNEKTFQFVFFGQDPSDTAYIAVEGSVVSTPEDVLNAFGAAIDSSGLQLGWSIDASSSPFTINLTNNDPSAGALGNTTISGTFETPANWTLTNFTGGANAEANTLLTTWEKQPPGATKTIDAIRDPDNNLWTLSSNRVAVRYNPDGHVLATINVPVRAGYFLVESMTEDAEGSVYFAGTASDGVRGNKAASEIYKFRQVPAADQDDLPTYEREWTWAVSRGRIYTLRVSLGTLYVTFASETEGTITTTGSIVGYSPLSSTVPIEAVSKDLPFRPTVTEALPDGNILLCLNRDNVQAAYTGTNNLSTKLEGPEIWTPWDLTNYRERLFFWTRPEDALASTGPDVLATDGDEIVEVPDHRLNPPSGYSSPHDTTERNLTKDERDGPSFKSDAFGTAPGLNFTATYTSNSLAGECLVSGANGVQSAKTTTSDSLSLTRGPIPSYSGSRYAMFFVVRLDPDDSDLDKTPQTRVLWSQRSPSSQAASPQSSSHAFITGTQGGDWTVGGFTSQPGGVWYNPGPYYADSGTHIPGSITNGDLSGISTSPNYNSNPLAGQRVAIVSIIKNQDSGTGGTTSVVRVNGRQVDAFQFLQDTCEDQPFILGCRRAANAESTTSDLFNSVLNPPFGEVASFKGFVGEMITILADSSADNSPHDLVVTCPIGFTGSGGDEESGYQPSGTTFPLAAHIGPEFASEVELVEGYLAARHGAQRVLPSGMAGSAEIRSSTGFYQRHPFGGEGWHPRGPEQENDDSFHLRQYLPKAVLLSPALDVLDSAYASGIGRLAGFDNERHVITGSRDTVSGHDYRFKIDHNAYFRRLTVNGGTFANNRHAYGWAKFDSIPPNGTTLTLSDGTNSVTFEFTTGSPSGSNTKIDTSTTPTTHRPAFREVMENAIDAIEASVLSTEVYHASPNHLVDGALFFVQANAGFSGNTTIATSSTDGTVVVSGFTGGSNQGDDWSFTDGASDTPLAGNFQADQRRMGVDADGNFYYGNRSIAGTTDIVGRKGVDGTLFLRHAFDDTETPEGVLPLVDPKDYAEEALDSAESLYVITSRGPSESDHTVYRLLTATSTELIAGGDYSTREAVYLGVSEGSIVKFTGGGSPSAIPTGAGVLTSGSPFVQSAVLFGDVFFTDGVKAYVYKVDDDVVEEFASKSAGAPPRRFRLIASWRDRLVLARVPGDDFNWYMSKQGDPFNWNEVPVVATQRQAVSGSGLTEDRGLGPGDAPDVINALIPWSDDLLIWGGDRSITRVTGDPMAGGQIDLVTTSTGIAFGSPWARSPSGVIYFFGSRGGVWAMTPNGQVERLTQYTIERRLRDLNLDANKVRLVWNYEDEGLHVIPIAYDLASTTVQPAWFLDVKHGAWFEDLWSSSDVMPTAVMLADGDAPGDRKVLFGCRDGRVRYWDSASATDDGYRIQSRVRLGPLVPEGGFNETRFSGLAAVLAEGQGGVKFDLFTGDTPSDLEPVGKGEFHSGRNAPSGHRWTGSSAWVTLRNGDATRWGLENLTVRAYRAGRKRVR